MFCTCMKNKKTHAAPQRGGRVGNGKQASDVIEPKDRSAKGCVWRLGVDIPLSHDNTVISENAGRIAKIEHLDQCPHLKRLSLIAQQVARIEGLEPTLELEELELYQNNVRKIENIGHLTQLRVLDLSFNQISTIENLTALVGLKKLFLSSNKISEIKGLETLTDLEELELGNNRIREIQNLHQLVNLKALWLGKNKITEMELPPLPCLERLSIQNNRLVTWNLSLFPYCPRLEELYLSHNGFTDIPEEIASLKFLRLLDLGANKISCLKNLAGCVNLEELWLNDNEVKDLDNLDYLKQLKKLETIYLERNSIQLDSGPEYRQLIVSAVPWLKQLDAIYLDRVLSVRV